MKRLEEVSLSIVRKKIAWPEFPKSHFLPTDDINNFLASNDSDIE